MYCSQCGKKVMDSMLFCPFCGSPIVIPEQDEVKPAAAKETEAELSVPDEPEIPGISFEATPEPEFVPLDVNIEWDKVDLPSTSEEKPEPFISTNLRFAEKENDIPEDDVSDEISELLSNQLRDEPVQLEGHVPDLTNVHNPDKNRPKSRKQANAYAPVKAFNPNDIFLDGEDEEDYDDYEDEEYDFEEPEEGGFLIRHIRGIVAFSLCIVVMAIFAGWAFSDAGQLALANANLAWRPGAYERLGYEAYQEGRYILSGNYYAKALSRDSDKYDYAYSAGVAYYAAEDTARAAEMAKRAIEIDAGDADAYHLLLRLYPSAETRPWEITELIRQGYQMTGDAALNVIG